MNQTPLVDWVAKEAGTDFEVPEDWASSVIDLINHAGVDRVLNGSSSTSLAPEGTITRVRLLDGQVVSQALPWMQALYESTFVRWAGDVSGECMQVADDARYGANVQQLPGGATGYELHVDSNPVTGVLFLEDIGHEQGGQLRFHIGSARLDVCPAKGRLLLFDGRAIPHEVLPVRGAPRRTTVVMNFFYEGDIVRASDLDEYLYEEIADAR